MTRGPKVTSGLTLSLSVMTQREGPVDVAHVGIERHHEPGVLGMKATIDLHVVVVAHHGVQAEVHKIQRLLRIGAEQHAVEAVAREHLGKVSGHGAYAHDDDVIAGRSRQAVLHFLLFLGLKPRRINELNEG